MSFCITHNRVACPHFDLTATNYTHRLWRKPPAGSTCDTLMDEMILALLTEYIARIMDPNSAPSPDQLEFLNYHLRLTSDTVKWLIVPPSGLTPIHRKLHQCEYDLEMLLSSDNRIFGFNQLAEKYNQTIRL